MGGMKRVYLDNAATTWPKPRETVRAVCDSLVGVGTDAASGYAVSGVKGQDVLFTARARIARLFGGYGGADPSYVTFTPNATYSLNTVLKGFLHERMRVVTTSMEHNSVMRPLRELFNNGCKTEFQQCSLRGYLSLNSLRYVISYMKPDLAVITHCSNVCGSIQPIEEIAELCARFGVPLVVDCAQTGGILSIDVQELGLAALCFTGHKWLYGPQGVGGIVWSPKFAQMCAPLVEGDTEIFYNDGRPFNVMPDRFEAGTPNLPGIAGLCASLKWLEGVGIKNIAERVYSLGMRLEEGLLRVPRLRMLGAVGECARRLPVYAFNIDGHDNKVLARDLSDIYGIKSCPGLHSSALAHKTLGTFPNGAVRLSPGYFNTEEDIDYAVSAVMELAKR